MRAEAARGSGGRRLAPQPGFAKRAGDRFPDSAPILRPAEVAPGLADEADDVGVLPCDRFRLELVPEPVVHPRKGPLPRGAQIELPGEAAGRGRVACDPHFEKRPDALLALAAVEVGPVPREANAKTLERLGIPCPDRPDLVDPPGLASVDVEAHRLGVEGWLEKPVTSERAEVLVRPLTGDRRAREITTEEQRGRSEQATRNTARS